MANGLNPTERAIVVIITFVIAVVLSVTLSLDPIALPALPLVAGTFLVPLLVGARALRLRAAVSYALALAAIEVVLLIVLGERSP